MLKINHSKLEELKTVSHFNRTRIKWNSRRYIDVETGTVIAKRCSNCGVVKTRKYMSKYKRNKDGLASTCSTCESVRVSKWKSKNKEHLINYRKENAEAKKSYNKKRYKENPKYFINYRKENAEYRNRYNKNYQKENPDKIVRNSAKRRALKRALPVNNISTIYLSTCALTEATTNLHLEHSIPLAWGHGGTTLENCYPLEGSLNQSKRDRNPFEWYENTGKYYGVKPELWNALIEELAKLHGITAQEYRDFVYWCEANKRTIEQVEADNKRYGYVVDSLTLYHEAVAKEATREIA